MVGLAGAALAFVYGLIGIFGGGIGLDSPLTLLAMPIALQEMVFAVWLIVKGLAAHMANPVPAATQQSSSA